MAQYDVIVVGAGGSMGSSAMYHLAKSGAKVLGLEAQPSAPHTSGSHHGLTRIIRLAYAEHPSYVPMLRRAYELWDDLEEKSGEHLLTVTGCINMSPPGLPESIYDGALESAHLHNLEHTVLTPAETTERFPGYSPPSDFQVLLEPRGGFLCPERCIEAHIAQALAAGAELVCGAPVVSWEVKEDGSVAVVTAAGTVYTAKKLILVPGAWLPALVPELKGLLTVERQVVGWFGVQSDPSHFTPDRFPVVVVDDASGMYYAFPADAHGFKIGKMHHRKQATAPDAVDREVTPEDEATLRGAVEAYFPGAAGPMGHSAVCLFTNTPDENFLIDVHPCHPQVILCSACSGHGFKFASVIGEVLKDLVLSGEPTCDITFLRFDSARRGHPAVLDSFRAAV